MPKYYDSALDPRTNEISRPYHIRSETKGGTTDFVLGVADLAVPASPNFPSTESGSATRYFLDLPMEAYRTSTNTTNFIVQNETQGVTLTVIEPSATLTDYTCRFFGVTSERRNILEIHVGSTSSIANDTISYEADVSGSRLYSGNIDEIETLDENSVSGTNRINRKVVELGVWDMNANTQFYFDHELDNYQKIRELKVMIRDDSTIAIFPLERVEDLADPGLLSGGIESITSTGILISRRTDAYFDGGGSSFTSTSINRGWAYITYED